MNSKSETVDARGTQFISFKSFSTFKRSHGEQPNEVVLTSPEIRARISWNELIASWNANMPTNAYLKVEVRAIYPNQTTKCKTRLIHRSADGPRPQYSEQPRAAEAFQRSLDDPRAASRDCSRSTKFYTMGLWSADPSQHPRQSVTGQKDNDGNVLTDVLVLKQPVERFQLRVTLGNNGKKKPKLKFLGVSLLNTNASSAGVLSPNRAAWGKTIDVPERSQMAYENGEKLCSPTTVSMLLAYWSKKLKRPEIDRSVPEVVEAVNDPNWPGTGNWSFNMAYAGSFRGMRAYVTRFSDVSELEDWIARGIPVGLSVCYNRLRGKSREPSGHVVVCCGFTETGDAIINDPGTSQNVRKIFPRANLIDAWSYSKNTVYLVYPTKAKLPRDRFGHWDVHTSR